MTAGLPHRILLYVKEFEIEYQKMLQQSAIERLEDSGHRLTNGRRRVLDVLAAQQAGIAAESVVGKLPDIGRATVYRTLRLLVTEGVLCKLAFEDGAPKYVLSSRMAHHHHAICVSCGIVREFRASILERALRGLPGAGGDRVVGHRIEVYIQCASCRSSV